MRLLLVEDNQVLANWLARTLSLSKYIVECAFSGSEADLLLATENYDVVLLDLALPRMDGREVLKRLRTHDEEVPVLIITAFDAVQERVLALDAGADDYLTKPFDVAELEARIRALLRRVNHRKSPLISCGSLTYDSNTRLFSESHGALELTPREHAVLEVLIMRVGRTVNKRSLADSLFAINEEVNPEAIEIYVHRLRKKLELSSARIITLRGLGYLLKASDGGL